MAEVRQAEGCTLWAWLAGAKGGFTITDKHFIDWESSVWGYGYGSGEPHTLSALKAFFDSLDGNSYSHETLGKAIGEMATWLLINTLCHSDIIEYGTSARYGWITDKGELLREFLNGKSVDDLYAIIQTGFDQDYAYCEPLHCNCDSPCNNPLFGCEGRI